MLAGLTFVGGGLVLLGVAALLGGVALLYRPELRVGWLGGRAKRADLPLTADGNERDYRIRVDSLRKTAFVAGLIYLVTFVSIPTLLLCGPVRNDQDRRRGWAKLRPPTVTSFAPCGPTIQCYYVPVVSNAE
ncbi:MAG: hypothetical protein K0R13_1812 [Propionibacteriaceae bacterium]|nr:hypothetical protein [Propionibacteriaceae bacterium]